MRKIFMYSVLAVVIALATPSSWSGITRVATPETTDRGKLRYGF